MNMKHFNRNHESDMMTSKKPAYSSMPMQINFPKMKKNNFENVNGTPTYIEVGSGSFKEGMPILCDSKSSSASSLNNIHLNHNITSNQRKKNTSSSSSSNCGRNNSVDNVSGDNLIESIADAMNEVFINNNSNNSTQQRHNHRNNHFQIQQQQQQQQIVNNQTIGLIDTTMSPSYNQKQPPTLIPLNTDVTNSYMNNEISRFNNNNIYDSNSNKSPTTSLTADNLFDLNDNNGQHCSYYNNNNSNNSKSNSKNSRFNNNNLSSSETSSESIISNKNEQMLINSYRQNSNSNLKNHKSTSNENVQYQNDPNNLLQ
jgi:hypothetical protein